ncbi:MAG: DNA repair protein RadC [Flavobacteriaceae bacterium]|nr:DNA repair protein RadC [Flavobacteriaceae bacterium]
MSRTYKQTDGIKNWAEEDRPREKMMLKGKAALSDAELLAIIMGSGNRNETAVDLARRIMNDSQNNWHEISRLELNDLCQYNGIGEAKAISIIAALEIGRRRAFAEALEKPQIKQSRDAFNLFFPRLGHLNYEEFWVMYLNHGNRVIAIESLSMGGLTQTVVDKRIIFKNALAKNATSIILAHNHPSGNLKPSMADMNVTKSIKAAGDIMTIELLDHLIIGINTYLSFKDEGLL